MARARARLLLASATALIGCVSANLPKPAAQNLYALDPTAAAGGTPAPGARTPIALAPLRAAPGLEGHGMIYVPREHEVSYFAHSAWVDTPGHMLAPLLARALEATGALEVVQDAASEPPARLFLETQILHLEQDFTVRPSRVRLELRIRLVDALARRILGDRVFLAVEPAAADDPYGGVVAANAAAARLLADVAATCAGWAQGAPPTSTLGSPGPPHASTARAAPDG